MLLNSGDTYRPTDGQLEIASLETDIMRFMAIIGFCLMIIFALVQSMPVSQSSAAIKDARSEQGQQLLAVTTQRADLSTLLSENQQLRHAQQQYVAKLDQIAHALRLEMEKLDQAESQLKQQFNSLRTLQQATRLVALSLVESKTTAEKLKDGQEKIARAQPSSQATPMPVEMQPRPNEAASAALADKGYTLQFESDAVFRQLVLSNKVQLFVQTAEGYLVFKQSGFVSATLNHSVYPMDETTVPEVFVKLRKGNSTGPVAWTVALPSATVDEVNLLMSKYQQGAMVIDRFARVYRK